MTENKKEPEEVPVHGRGTSRVRVAMLMTASFIAGALVVYLPPAVERYHEAVEIEHCAKNLMRFGLLCKMHAGDHRARFPPLSRVPGKFMPDWGAIHPEYIEHKYIDYPKFLTCPSDVTIPPRTDVSMSTNERATLWDDYSYVYFGYEIADEGQAFTFLEAYEQIVTEAIHSTNLTFDKQLGEWLLPESFWNEGIYVGEKRGHEDGDYLFRLFEGRNMFDVIHRMNPPPSPSNSTFIVMFDRPGTTAIDFNHVPAGANILFMDGHVEYGTVPSDKFVLSPRFIQEFLEMEARVEKLYADFVDAQEK